MTGLHHFTQQRQMVAGYNLKAAAFFILMEDTAIIRLEHGQQLFKGKLKNITKPKALIQPLGKFIAHPQLPDQLVGAFIQLRVLKGRTGGIRDHCQEAEIQLMEGGLVHYHMKHTVYPLLAAERKPYLYDPILFTPGMKHNPPILEGPGTDIIARPFQRKRLDLRMRAAVILGHEEIKARPGVHRRDTVNNLSQHGIYIDVVMHALNNLKKQRTAAALTLGMQMNTRKIRDKHMFKPVIKTGLEMHRHRFGRMPSAHFVLIRRHPAAKHSKYLPVPARKYRQSQQCIGLSFLQNLGGMYATCLQADSRRFCPLCSPAPLPEFRARLNPITFIIQYTPVPGLREGGDSLSQPFPEALGN